MSEFDTEDYPHIKRRGQLHCPHCKFADSKVIDSRGTERGYIRRRRECLKCAKRFTTWEILATDVDDYGVGRRMDRVESLMESVRDEISRIQKERESA